MKNIAFISLFLILLFVDPDLSAQDLYYLQNIQMRLDGAFNRSFAQNSMAPLDSVLAQLEAIKQRNNLITYWLSYTRSMETLYCLHNKQSKEAEALISRACDDMENLEKKNTEDYALLAMAQNLSIQFRSGMNAGKLSTTVVENARKALQMDSTNLRAWYVLGANDFYTPAFFGGGKETEAYLLKALACPSQKVANPYMPSWGRDESYHLLLTYYLQEEQYDSVRGLLEKAKKEYPEGRWFITLFEQKLKK